MATYPGRERLNEIRAQAVAERHAQDLLPCPDCGLIGGEHDDDCQAIVDTDLEPSREVLPVFDKLAVVAREGVISTGNTNIIGRVGVWPAKTIDGFPPGIAGGFHRGDGDALTALKMFEDEFKELMGKGFDKELGKLHLSGNTLKPGGYHFLLSAHLSGTLILEGPGQFVFLVGEMLTTGSDAEVKIRGECDVTWLVGGSALVGAMSVFYGDIIARESIALAAGAEVQGKLAALGGQVRLDAARVG